MSGVAQVNKCKQEQASTNAQEECAAGLQQRRRLWHDVDAESSVTAATQVSEQLHGERENSVAKPVSVLCVATVTTSPAQCNHHTCAMRCSHRQEREHAPKVRRETVETRGLAGAWAAREHKLVDRRDVALAALERAEKRRRRLALRDAAVLRPHLLVLPHCRRRRRAFVYRSRSWCCRCWCSDWHCNWRGSGGSERRASGSDSVVVHSNSRSSRHVTTTSSVACCVHKKEQS